MCRDCRETYRLAPLGLVLVASLLLTGVVGCGRSTQTAKPTASEAEMPAATSETEDTVAVLDEDHDAAARIDVAVASQPSETESQPEHETATERPPFATTARLLVLTPEWPLIIDLAVTVDGQPLQDKFNESIAFVRAYADQNGDGNTTWKEMTTHVGIVYGQLGSPPINTQRQRQDLIRAYDINRNEMADADEIPGFLSQDPRNSRLLKLDAEVVDFNDVTRKTPLWEQCDLDHDGQLSSEEQSLARASLERLDRNSDQGLTRDELAAVTVSAPDRRSRGEIPVAFLLDQRTDLTSLLFDLETRYAFGSQIALNDLADERSRRFFRQLDSNQNGWFDSSEVPSLLQIQPDTRLIVEFDSGSEDGPSDSVRLSGYADPSDDPTADDELSLTLWAANRLSIKRSGAVSVMTAVGRPNASRPGSQSIVRDEAWQRIDRDGDGFLDRMEFDDANGREQLRAPFEVIDLSGDQQIAKEEVLEVLRQREQASLERLNVAVRLPVDPLFAFINQNGDDQLAARELANIRDALLTLDQDQNGLLSIHELPFTLEIELRLGSGEDFSTELLSDRVASAQGSSAESGPSWYRAMDLNRDGDLSRREFLGTSDQFDQLDRDQDGFVSAAEASAAGN